MCTQSSTLYKNKLNHSVGCKYSKVIRFWFPLQNTILYEVVIPIISAELTLCILSCSLDNNSTLSRFIASILHFVVKAKLKFTQPANILEVLLFHLLTSPNILDTEVSLFIIQMSVTEFCQW